MSRVRCGFWLPPRNRGNTPRALLGGSAKAHYWPGSGVRKARTRDMESLAGPTVRAKRIARGLMRTGRAIHVIATTKDGFMCLRSAIGGVFWVCHAVKLVWPGENFNEGARLLVRSTVGIAAVRVRCR